MDVFSFLPNAIQPVQRGEIEHLLAGFAAIGRWMSPPTPGHNNTNLRRMAGGSRRSGRQPRLIYAAPLRCYITSRWIYVFL